MAGGFIQFMGGGIVEGAGGLALTAGQVEVTIPLVAAGQAIQANALVNIGVGTNNVHNALYHMASKQGGKYTESTLPPKLVVKEGGIEITYNRPGPIPGEPKLPGVKVEHPPGHLHIKGGGPEITIGQGGKPLDPGVELTQAQQQVVNNNRQVIEKAVDKLQRWFRYMTEY